MRSIICVYIQSFFALLEQKRKPELSRKPVVVTRVYGGVEFVVSASPEAKLQGVYEGMAARHAGRYCPDAHFVAADWNEYKDASEKMLDVLTAYSPLIEPSGLDKAFLDVTGTSSLFGNARSIADNIHRKISEEIGIAPSIGIAQSKLIACAVTTKCKAGKTLVVLPGGEKEFIAQFDVRILPGVGEKLEKKFHTLGIYTVGELAAISERTIVRQFGSIGSNLHKLAHGIDHSLVKAIYPPDTISILHRFDLACDTCEPEFADAFITLLCEEISIKLQSRNQRVGNISLRIEFEDGRSSTGLYTSKSPISSFHEIRSIAIRLFRELVCDSGIISINIIGSDLKSTCGVQLNLLEDNERKQRLDSTIRNVRSRFGEKSIIEGSALMMAG